MCTCSGTVSRRLIARRIESYWPGVARTSSALDSSIAVMRMSSLLLMVMPSPLPPPEPPANAGPAGGGAVLALGDVAVALLLAIGVVRC